MDKEIQDMLNDLPNKKFAKLTDKQLERFDSLSQNMKGNNNPFSGKKHNEISLKKIGESSKLRTNGMTGKKHSNETKKIIGKKSKEQNRDELSISVLCFSYKDNNFICEYPSLTKACNELNLNRECARLTCVNKRNHTGGYYFRYKE